MVRVKAARTDVWSRSKLTALLESGALIKRDPATDITNDALVNGRIVLAEETPLVNVTREHVRYVAQHAPCQQNISVPIVMCGYVRNRVKLTLEWIQWNRILGVRRVHIFDDHSTDGLREYLQPFIDEGVVIYHPSPRPPYKFNGIPVKGGLLSAYWQCLDYEAKAQSWAPQHTYVGLIDPDEFVVLPESGMCLHTIVREAVDLNPEKSGAVAFPWRMVSPAGEMIDRFKTQMLRTNFSDGLDDHVVRIKNIVRADLAVNMGTAHRVDLRPPFVTVWTDRTGTTVTGPGWFTNRPGDHQKRAYLAHYHVRSLISWLSRYLEGYADSDGKVYPFSVETYYAHWSSGKRSFGSMRENARKVVLLQHKILLASLGLSDDA